MGQSLPSFGGPPWSPAGLVADYLHVRRTTEALCAPLETEDYLLQAMPDASPTKWHIAHVSWFFETFLLKPFLPGYKPFHPQYEYLYNSYYNAVGPQWSRRHRGHLSRPTVKETFAYRAHVDDAMVRLLEQLDERQTAKAAPIAVLGMNHEQQHQELLLTDIKYNLSVNPLHPAYHQRVPPPGKAAPLTWVEFSGGIVPIGHEDAGFCFDNEGPRHQALLRPFSLASRPVTNGEYLEFMEAGGYQRSELWLSLGWQYVQEHGWSAPLYWERDGARWWAQTLAGFQPVDEHAPLTHISFCEADAYARWKSKRLPTEFEWEHAASGQPIQGNFMDSGIFHPISEASLPVRPEHERLPSREASPELGRRESKDPSGPLRQLFGDVWEWTASPYAPYPGYRPDDGALGEYNGKFMLNQLVLRGGSCATPQSHIRATYRNFFPPDARWQFTGIRLAQDL